MARRKLTYTHFFPYHVWARSNNKEWFYLSKMELWKLFVSETNRLFPKMGVLLHAFVLMDNHYHMVLSTDERYQLGKVMCELQKSISRNVNRTTGRTNHVFGGPYRASLITTSSYYASVFRYVYRNPVRVDLCRFAEDYLFSTLRSDELGTSSPLSGIASEIPPKDLLDWLNTPADLTELNAIRAGLHRTVFKPTYCRSY